MAVHIALNGKHTYEVSSCPCVNPLCNSKRIAICGDGIGHCDNSHLVVIDSENENLIIKEII